MSFSKLYYLSDILSEYCGKEGLSGLSVPADSTCYEKYSASEGYTVHRDI